MAEPLLIANLCFFADDGHNHYRVHAPSRMLAGVPGVTAVDCDLYHRAVPWLAESADVLVLHGLNPEWHPIILRRRTRGQVTVFEASDNYLDIQPWTDYSAGWLDRSLQDLFLQTLAAADAVQTGTPALADVWRPHARRVLVLPNPAGPVPPLRPAEARPLTVGWAGSATHLADLAAVAPALERWVAAHPTARLAVMTDPRARGLFRLPPGRLDFRPPGPLAAYHDFLAGLDVGFIPLLPGPFNAGRTDLKFWDYAAAGVAGVYPRAGPYGGAVADGETGLFYATPGELVAAVDRLASDPALRTAVRGGAHAAAERNRAADGPAPRLSAYRELLGRPGRAGELPAELLAGAAVDGGYVRLEPGPPERALAAAIQTGASDQTAAVLADLLREFPAYPAAARQLTRVLNDLGRHADARRIAEQLVADTPDSPGAHIELARALTGMGRADAARYHLERAVVLNPRHPVAWGLLRAGAADADDARRAATLWARNAPSQYLPALARVPLLPPAEAATELARVAARFIPTLHDEERPYAAAAFAHAAAALAETGEPADLEPALTALSAAFPESARLADLAGECLSRLGRGDAADAAFLRAGALHRAAAAYLLDGEWADARAWRWQVASYAARGRLPEAPG